MSISIAEVNTKNEKVRKDLIDYLAPNETKALFLLGNLQANFHPSFLYVASHNKRLLGVCGFYPTFGSCSIFSENEEVSRLFAKRILQKHAISALLGMKTMIQPAFEEFLKQGKKSINFPQTDFYELKMENFRPYFSKEGKIRPIEEKDAEAVVFLQRQIHHIPKENPITEEERARVIVSSVKFCMEMEGKIVTVAISNGLAIKAFQILGVATDPAFQKKGYAKAVCSYLISYMKDKGATQAIIFTGEDNMAAKKCYLDLGFQITDKYYVAFFEGK